MKIQTGKTADRLTIPADAAYAQYPQYWSATTPWYGSFIFSLVFLMKILQSLDIFHKFQARLIYNLTSQTYDQLHRGDNLLKTNLPSSKFRWDQSSWNLAYAPDVASPYSSYAVVATNPLSFLNSAAAVSASPIRPAPISPSVAISIANTNTNSLSTLNQTRSGNSKVCHFSLKKIAIFM